MPTRVTASCPSSIANVGPGFDIVALAIEAYRDFVSVAKKPGSGKVLIDEKSNGGFGAQNTALTSVGRLMEDSKVKSFDVSISLTKKVPIGVGLGSSGASAAGSVFAANHALELGLKKTELVKFAAYGEISAAGAPHADNVSAALMGGLACVFDAERDQVFSIDVPRNIVITILLIRGVDSKDKTRRARDALPSHVDLLSAVKQAASASRLLFSAARGDWKTFASAVNSDIIVEKAREKIYPWFPTLKSAALEFGALGCSLCGAGPSVFALSLADGKRLNASKWLSTAKEEGLECSVIETRVDNEGAKIETPDE